MRIVVVDDSLIVREGIVKILALAGHDVTAALHRTEGLNAVVAAERPDLIILDIRMPPTHTDEGLRAASTLRMQYPSLGILVLSQYMVPEYANQLLETGERYTGYLLKDRILDVAHLSDAVDRITSGGTVIDPDLVGQLIHTRRNKGPLADLSTREAEVLALMAEGLSDKGISDRLFLTTNTVRTHVQHIFDKLGVPDQATDNRRVRAVINHLQHSRS